MSLSRHEQRHYDRWYRWFSKYGFDIREAFTEEWFHITEEARAQQTAEKIISSGGIFLSCINCGSKFYVTSEEIQKIRATTAKRPELCKKCAVKADLARIAHQGAPYKNRIVDNLGVEQLDLIGTGERRWEKGIREANRYSYELPDSTKYDHKNEALVKWVHDKALEGLRKAEEEYRVAEGYRKELARGSIAPFIWILEVPFSITFENCIREYIGLPLIPPKKPENCNPHNNMSSNTTAATVNSDVLPKTNIATVTPKAQTLKDYFLANGLNVIDKRPSGGCLWVIGNEASIQRYTDEASKAFEISGCFCDGGKATNYKRSWYTKSTK